MPRGLAGDIQRVQGRLGEDRGPILRHDGAGAHRVESRRDGPEAGPARGLGGRVQRLPGALQLRGRQVDLRRLRQQHQHRRVRRHLQPELPGQLRRPDPRPRLEDLQLVRERQAQVQDSAGL